MTATPEPLPVGSRLLHIGPHKTGTTALQAAFHESRDSLESQGVHYAGERGHSMVAAMAAAGRQTLPTLSSAAVDEWNALVEEVATTRALRVALSSEFFADASAERAADIVRLLGGDDVHVVVTLRSLVRILPSQWQQYMQNAMITDYERWLELMLVGPESTTMTPSFWRRHRHDRLVNKWVDVVGRDRLTVVVADERDKTMITTAFETLLGVRPGTLKVQDSANRSLTFPEIETVRALNQLWRARGWSSADYTRLVRFGAARYLQQRDPHRDEPRLLTPEWAVERAMAVQREMIDSIAGLGVRVLGDLESLADPAAVRDVGVNDPVSDVPRDVAVALATGLAKAVTDIPRRPSEGSRVVGPFEAAARLRPPGLPPAATIEEAAAPGGARAVLRSLVRRVRTGFGQ